mgnify:CR=1 FL=1
MQRFIARHRDHIKGVLNGFDRLLFRGTLLNLAHTSGFQLFLNVLGVLRKNCAVFFQQATERLLEASLRVAKEQGRPILYLASSRSDKEAEARAIAKRDSINEGLICVLTSVEPCASFQVYRNRETKRTEIRKHWTKCKHLYSYWIDPVFGFMHARLQTWFPFSMQIYINGREWLSRQMSRAGIAYERRDNCFVGIQDLSRAQRLADAQRTVPWERLLGRIARRAHPALSAILHPFRSEYFWSLWQSEWATDVMFDSQAALARIYRPLIHHGISSFSSADVMRFLGAKVNGNFAGEIVSDFKNRPEGVRIKHSVDHNSVKLYDKQGSVLRVETTINDSAGIKVYRAKQGDPRGPKTWRPLRQGIADLPRRSKVSQACNERYLNALAVADTSARLGPLLQEIVRPVCSNKTRVRGLRPWSPEDLALFTAVNRGEFCINGFRNRDLQGLLYSDPPQDKTERRQRASRLTRLIRMLRAHALIRKQSGSHRYHVTPKGRELFTAILAAQEITLAQLKAAA